MKNRNRNNNNKIKKFFIKQKISNWNNELYYVDYPYMRHPKTKRDIQQYYMIKNDKELKEYKLKYKKEKPVSSWDDIKVSMINPKSWKKISKRKKQFKDVDF